MPWMPSQSSTKTPESFLMVFPWSMRRGSTPRHHRQGIKRKTVAEAVNEMIAARDRKGVSDVYLADLRYRLGMFAEAFHCD